MKIIFGIAGSIAAYRAPDALKELVKVGHEVQPLLTHSAKQFVTSKTLETFSGKKLFDSDPFAADHMGTDHISLSRWADVIVVYAATAHILAKMAQGLADDFLSLQILAFQQSVLVVPAMNPAMWNHAATRRNVALLKERGVIFVGPIEGLVACGEEGTGHVADTKDLVAALNELSSSVQGPLKNKQILFSVGPMQSSLDPVRFVQNRSSGRMGLALAQEAHRQGARVSVLLGPVEEAIAEQFAFCEVQNFRGSREYQEQLDAMFPSCDVFMSLAAVLDFEIVGADKKIERQFFETHGEYTLSLKTVPDIVARMASQKKPHQKVIAFAAESGSEKEILSRAKEKLQKKQVDALVANPVWPSLGPEAKDNQLWLLRDRHEVLSLGPAPKNELARPLLEALFF